MDPMTIASGIADSVGSLFKGIMGFNAGNAQATAKRYAAQQAEQQGGLAASNTIEEGNALAASGAVASAANGGGFVGSSLAAIQSLANRSMFNARTAAYRGRVAAQNDMYEADVAKADANNALWGGVLGATGALGGSLAKAGAQSRQEKALSKLKGDGGGSSGSATTYGDGDF